MKISAKTIKYLQGIITGDSRKTPYLSGRELVDFFRNFGFNDEYGQGFPSRWFYCEQKLLELNKLNKIQEVIEFYYHPINFIENKEQFNNLVKELNDYLTFDDLELRVEGKMVRLYKATKTINITTNASFTDNKISILLQEEVFNHVNSYLKSEHYFSAVEESYKIVRHKLKEVTGKEKATEAFAEANLEKIFGHKPQNEAEKDFFEGVKFLHMSIQFLRNEKSHTPAKEMDKNLAIHYIVLASLAYDLINRKNYDPHI
jgi:uncharacterized protein (TIGR02391 family)